MSNLPPVNMGSLMQGPSLSKNGKDTPEATKKALVDFESLFINQMLKSMRSTVMKSDLLDGGSGEKMYMDMFDMEISKSMAASGGIGIASMMMKQLAKEQGGKGAGALMNLSYGSHTTDNPTPDAGKSGSFMRGGVNRAYNGIAAERSGPGESRESMTFPIHGADSSSISSNFGLRNDPFTGERKAHHGIDIAAKAGTPIYPSASGVVSFSGRKDGYGNVVEVKHDNGFVTKYAHTMENLVKEGDKVDVNSPIAYVGSTGHSTGAHLHFEVTKNGYSINPHLLGIG